MWLNFPFYRKTMSYVAQNNENQIVQPSLIFLEKEVCNLQERELAIYRKERLRPSQIIHEHD